MQNRRPSEIVIIDKASAHHCAQLTLAEKVPYSWKIFRKYISGFQSSFQDIASSSKIHHYHLTALSLIGGNFKEQPGTELQKTPQ